MDALTTCLWFDTQGDEAAKFYTGIFPHSSVGKVTPYPAGTERAGQTMTVDFVLNGSRFVALNGGPEFSFNESISFQVPCEDQAEVDYYWTALLEGGEESMCGWLKDKFGVSWQIVPKRLEELIVGDDREQAERVTQALFQMKKIVIADLEAAAASTR
jgi:predicted 3-demethylubiquinone-9 3-methyltransferase (glyoxalase superfamily)